MFKSLLKAKHIEQLKIYGLIVTWLLYLVSLPWVYANQKILCLFYIIFPGLYLFPLFGLLIHESWHKYLPSVPNKILFPIFCFMLISDPQVYDLTHRSHHTDVNSYQDMQFYPLSKIKKRYLRIIYNFFEIFLGAIFVMTIAGIRLSKEPRFKKQYSYQKFLVFLLCRISFIVGISFCSHLIFGIKTSDILIPYLSTYWGGSLIIHHSMLIEHGNLIVEDKLPQRNIRTRNLKSTGIIEKIVLIFTHDDPLEHTLHHSFPQSNTRPAPDNLSMPDGSVYITFWDYLGILKDMLIGIEANDCKFHHNVQ